MLRCIFFPLCCTLAFLILLISSMSGASAAPQIDEPILHEFASFAEVDFASLDGAMVADGALTLGVEPLGEWVEIYKGKADFGLCTGVFWIDGNFFFMDSPTPASKDGGDVYVWDAQKGEPRLVLQVDEQGVSYIRSFDGTLYIPGADATDDWTLGNFYRSRDGGEKWEKVRTIPVGVHIWDVCLWRGKLYVSTGSVRDGKGYGAVCESSDDGATWVESLKAFPDDTENQFARCYVLIPTEDALYASWVGISGEPRKYDVDPHDFYVYDGKEWKPTKLLPELVTCKNFGLRHREFGDVSFIAGRPNSYLLRDGKTTKVVGLEQKNTFDFVRGPGDALLAVATDTETEKSALYSAAFDDVVGSKGGFTELAGLPEGCEGLSLAMARGRVYCGAKAEGGGRLIAQKVETAGIAVMKPVRVPCDGALEIAWEGSQPDSTAVKLQVRSCLALEDLEGQPFVGPGGDAKEYYSGNSFRVDGLPEGEVWVQIKVVMGTSRQSDVPVLAHLWVR